LGPPGPTRLRRAGIYANEITVFWVCGVTPQAVAEKARVEFMITHEPAQMPICLGRETAGLCDAVA
jgi:uncharacterized protein YcsI (UPF0317 family)